jgi:O-antigen/teichoic acid export membrane protein
MMVDKLRRLATQSAFYALSNVIVRGANYVLIPIYARLLSPTEYGLLGITLAVMNLASLGLMFGVYAAVARLYFDYSDDMERRVFLGLTWGFLTLAPLVVLVGFDRVGSLIFGGWLRQVPYDPYIRLALWSAYLSNFGLLPTTIFRNREQAGRVLALAVCATTLSVASMLLFVVVFKQGVAGIVVASLLANLAMAGVYSWVMAREVKFAWRPAVLQKTLVYSLPFWPHALAGWLLNLSDRILLERFVPLAQVGLYSLGYQIGQALSVLIEAGNQAWAPFFFRSQTEQPQSPVMPKMATYFVLAASGLCLTSALLARPALRVFTPENYWASEPVAAIIAIGFLALAPYYIWANALMHSKTVSGFPIITMLAGIINVGLNLIAIPRWGIVAAAVNTVLGYVALAVFSSILASRVYPVQHEYSRWLKAIGLASLVGGAGQLIRAENLWLEGLLRTLMVGVWFGALAVAGFFGETERAILMRRWR